MAATYAAAMVLVAVGAPVLVDSIRTRHRPNRTALVGLVVGLGLVIGCTLALGADAHASYYIGKREAVSHARQVVRDRGTWSADIAGDYYEMTFDRTQALWARPKARTPRRGSLAHAWAVGVVDPGQRDCRDAFGAGVFGIPGVTLSITGSREPGMFWWRTIASVRCFGDLTGVTR